jgi:Cu/Ag efflux protein CusF
MNKWFLGAALALCLPAGAQGEWVAGEVVKVDAARGRITLKHAPIKSVKMAAMTMGFPVVDRSVLGAYKPGDRVRFAVVVHEDELLVTRIESAP